MAVLVAPDRLLERIVRQLTVISRGIEGSLPECSGDSSQPPLPKKGVSSPGKTQFDRSSNAGTCGMVP